MSDHPLIDRYQQLEQLKLKVEAELIAVQHGLQVAGILGGVGRPRIIPTHTSSQARAAHAAWQRGERDDWTVNGERQYQREKKRSERIRRKAS